MRALRIAQPIGPQGLVLEGEAPSPSCGPDQVRVRVRASALNRADLLQTKGLYPAPPGVPSDIPGLEYAGEIIELGARVGRWKLGERVMGLVGGGAWAEELTVHEREAVPVPRALSWTDAAAIPEAFLTAWDALVVQGGATLGSRVLIHAVASGVGTAAVQLCAVLGAVAVGTGRNPEKLARVTTVGPVHPVLVTREAPQFSAEVLRALEGRGADVVLDLVGGEWLPETLAAMAPGGTLMLVGLVGGASAKVPLTTILGKRLTVRGTTMRSRPLEEKILAARQLEGLVPLFDQGRLRPVVDAVVPMAEVPAALERLATNQTFGKLVVTW
jgi:putative PIG3 family NAD(P)H quinone oxidoreductase